MPFNCPHSIYYSVRRLNLPAGYKLFKFFAEVDRSGPNISNSNSCCCEYKNRTVWRQQLTITEILKCQIVFETNTALWTSEGLLVICLWVNPVFVILFYSFSLRFQAHGPNKNENAYTINAIYSFDTFAKSVYFEAIALCDA